MAKKKTTRKAQSKTTAKHELLPAEQITQAIHLIRGQRVMLDADLAELYGTTTSRINEQVKRNRKRFPARYLFRLTRKEVTDLTSQSATSRWGGRRSLPHAFTEHGAVMLATVLNTPTAIQASIHVVDAFVSLRKLMASNAALAKKIEQLSEKVNMHDNAIAILFHELNEMVHPQDEPESKERIGFKKRT